MTIDIESLVPIPGKSYIRIEDRFANVDSFGLALPDQLRGQSITVGVVLKSSMTDKDRALLGIDDLSGRRVLISNRAGTAIADGIISIPNTFKVGAKGNRYDTPILAILPHDAKATPSHDEQPRCMFCGPANINVSPLPPYLVTGYKDTLYCPRCNKKQDGSKYDPQNPYG